MTLKVQQSALEMIAALRPIVRAIERQDRALGIQIRRAASSVSLTLGEGTYSRKGNQPARFHEALASGNEVRTAIEVALAWGYVTRPQVAEAQAVIDRMMAMIWRLLHPKA
jgi:four helix bundle protein